MLYQYYGFSQSVVMESICSWENGAKYRIAMRKQIAKMVGKKGDDLSVDDAVVTQEKSFFYKKNVNQKQAYGWNKT